MMICERHGTCLNSLIMPRLTTHALDIVKGGPASGLRVVLRREGAVLVDITLNADGRGDSPLLEGGEFSPATYELTFHVGAYFVANGVASPFLDTVPVRFNAAPGESYHVPLVFSPWAFQTYRGS